MKVKSWITATIFVGMIGLSGVILTPTVAQVISQLSSQDQEFLAELERLVQQSNELSQQRRYSEAIPLLEKVLAMVRQQLGDNHLSTAKILNNLANLYQLQGRYAEAEPLYQQALTIRKQQLGNNHPDTARSLHNLARLYRSQGRYTEAEPLYQQELAIIKQLLGESHHYTAIILNNLAENYESQGRYTEAEPLYQQALAIHKQQLGNNHPSTAANLNNLAFLYQSQGRYTEAEPLFQQALAIFKQRLGDNHPVTATNLNNLANLYQLQGRYTEAEPLYQQALAIRKQRLGDNHPETATSLNSLALLYQTQGRYAEAESLFQQALAIVRQQLGENHPSTATSLNNLANLYQLQGRYADAEPLYKEALAIHKQRLGDNHPSTANSLNNLANLYQAQGRYTDAESLHKEALAIFKQQLGDNHPQTVTSLNNLARLYSSQGRYTDAELFYKEALAIFKQQLGENHPSTATSLTNLAAVYHSQGRYTDVESLLQQALAINKQQLGENHPSTATNLNNLAELYRSQGRYADAEPLHKEALAISKQQLGENHPDTASSLNNLANLYHSQGRYADAEPLYKEALAINKQQLGENHPSTALSLNNLAGIYQSQGRHADAEPLHKEALAINKQQLGENHPSTALSLNNLAELYRSQGRYADAEPLHKEALTIRKQQLGENHPDTASSLSNLAGLYQAQENIPQAINYLTQAIKIEEYNLSENLNIGDEEQKQRYMGTILGRTKWVISLNLQSAPNNLKATQLALKTILQRKGRILDVSTNSLQILRQRTNDPESQQLLTQLIEIWTAQSNLIFKKSEDIKNYRIHRQLLINFRAKSKEIEDKIGRHSAEFRQLSQPITLEAIQQQIPKNSALVEIVRYQFFNPKATKDSLKWGSPRYAVYILFPNGEIKAKDLGEAKPIDDNLIDFRNNLRDRQTPVEQVKKSARQLDAKLMQPIRQLLGDTKTILLSPDGALNLIPFEALVDENNQYLVENYKITYLTSGRDLLRLKEKFVSEQPPLILANPTYTKEGEVVDLNPTQNYSEENQTRSVELSEYIKDTVFLPLSGTEQEAEAIQNILQLPKNRVLSEKQATEDALKQVRKPNILHIATHGFFLESKKTNDNEPSTQTNPLLYSGLVLAGVKADIEPRRRTGDNGILTALETTVLNLVGTKLVVLSACDTGRGDITTGEGIYGLRRALVIAGSESQLISLWKVSDKVTKDLMVAYYERLRNGKGRSEALRNVQLEMLKNEDQSHPFYWAGFIPSGDWTPMEFNSAK